MVAAFGTGAFLCAGTGALADGSAALAPDLPIALVAPLPAVRALSSLASAGALAALALAGGALSLRWFRKTASSEILFFGLALASLSVEGLRPFLLLARAAPGAVIIPSILTRAILSARWAGTSFLLGASLYAGGLEYGKSGQAALIAGFLSIVVGGTLPLHTGRAYETFLVQSGLRAATDGAMAAMNAMSVVGYVIASKRQGSRDYAWMAVGMGLGIAGRLGLLHAADPVVCAASLASLGAGAFLYLRKQYKRAMWG